MSGQVGLGQAESLMPQGASARPESTGVSNPEGDLESAEKCCQPCQGLSDGDSILTQRRSMGEKPPKLRPAGGANNTSPQSQWLPSVAVWSIAGLGLMMLLFSLLAFETPSELLHYLEDLPVRIYGNLVPIGANLWLFQWRYQGQMDPRPLWDPAMMGSKATWLHGSSQGLSEALQANKSKTVAVVGNGPISDKQRLKISEADIIVRFNAMNNRRESERVDLWVVRNNHMMPYLYWGFEQLADEEVVRVLEKAKAVLFLSDFKPLTRGINRKAEVMVTRFVQEWFSSARDEQLHQVDIEEYWQLYTYLFSKTGQTELNTTDVMPSSGLLGILAVLDLIPKQTQISMYGFNWNDRSYVQHMMSTEELIVQALRKSYPRLRINPTACNGLYHCNQICDTAQFRLAVDEENCQRQLAKAEAGEEARFIDLHTTQHLEWHASLLAELKAKAKKAGIAQPSNAMLQSMAKEIAEGKGQSNQSKRGVDKDGLPSMFHQKVNLAKLVASDRPRSIAADGPDVAESQAQAPPIDLGKAPAVETKLPSNHLARKLRRPQPHL